MLTRSWAFPGFVALTLSACTAHPRPAEPTLPVPLVAALMDERSGRAVRPRHEFTVGVLPPEFPATLVPPGPVTIVGGMTGGDEIVVILADSTRRITAVLEDHFASAGFARPPEEPGVGFSRRSGPYDFFCKDSATVSAVPLTGDERTFARVTYQRMGRRYGCANNFPESMVSRPRKERLTLPELTPPSGFSVWSAGGGGGNDDEVGSHAKVSASAIVPRSLLAHYAAQLVAAGWTASAPAIGDRVAAQSFVARDSSDGAWDGVLMVTGSGMSGRLTLTMERRTTP